MNLEKSAMEMHLGERESSYLAGEYIFIFVVFVITKLKRINFISEFWELEVSLI